MTSNPFLGVVFHWLGGLASGSFYVPYRFVRKWSWETYWLTGGFFSWIIAPWLLGLIMTRDLPAVISEAPGSTLFWTYFFGVLWGMGGLTFGLTILYLGMSLGMAVALGYTAAFGTLVPPIFHGELYTKILTTVPGLIVLFGVFVCMAGIAVAGMAGMSKEREMSEEQKKASIKEFDFKKGILVATFSGVMSACFSFGLDAGRPIKKITLEHGTTTLWQGLPVLVVLLVGGFTTNFIWCMILHLKNKTGYQYLSPVSRGSPTREEETIIETTIDAPSEEVVEHATRQEKDDTSARVPLFCVLELPILRPGGHDLVLPVFLLHHGRDPDGTVQVLELDSAHGQHHDLQHPLGNRAAGMGGNQPTHLASRRSYPARAHRFDRDHRLRQLAGLDGNTLMPGSSAWPRGPQTGACRSLFNPP
ncbi:MAG: L-rhamnose/proton symporter RhaT [Isosphaeraceae bacterium]